MKHKEKASLSAAISIAVLICLALINALWVIRSGYGGALIAFVFYLVIAFLCVWRRHFEAGIIAGVLGFCIHLFELFIQGSQELVGVDLLFFYANLILPIPLAITSYLETRKAKPYH
jgi:hypothetical protein